MDGEVKMKTLHEKTDEEKLADFSHNDICEYVRGELNNILKDPLLRDLPQDPTSDEISSRIALEKGKAIVIKLKRLVDTEETLSLVVQQNATVKQLKLTIQRYLSLKLKREGGPTYLSWRYFWKTYWLVHNGEKLTDDKRQINEYGICNQSPITFIKRLRR